MTKSIKGKLSLATISITALLPGVIRLLEDREAFKDATNVNEKIYHGDVFEAIASEWAQFGDQGSPIMPSKEVLDQLDELAELISEDYVLIT